MSSRRASLKRSPVTQHRPENIDPPTRQGNQGSRKGRRCQQWVFGCHVSEQVSARIRDPCVTKTKGVCAASRVRPRRARISRYRESSVHGAPAEPLGRGGEASRRSWRWPPPVSAEHAALRQSLHGATSETPDLANDVADLLVLMQEEQRFLASLGVDPRPWGW